MSAARRCAGAVASFAAIVWVSCASAASVLSLGPHSVQTLVTSQLFNRGGRWYLIDDGACRTYLESPHTRLELDRLVLSAHLSSRLGQRIGSDCAGADFASGVVLSGRLHGTEHRLILDDIRIDHVDDDATRDALNLALQLTSRSIPRAASIDVLEYVRKQVVVPQGSVVRLDQLRIVNVATRADAVVIQFDLDLSSP